MARFVFQLDGVLRQRKEAEQQRQRELAVVQAEMVSLHNELRSLDEQVRQVTEDLRANHLIGRIDLAFLAAHRRFIGDVQRKAVNRVQKMALLQRQVDDARVALIEASKQRKVLEKLREKHEQRWREALSRREVADTDETGMQISHAWRGEQTEPTT